MTADDLGWPAMALGALDADLRVLGPPAVVDELAARAARITRAVAASRPARTG
jgi:hypothetical protein